MRFVALVSGGKDSIYSIIEALRQGHVIVGCVHLSRPSRTNKDKAVVQSTLRPRDGEKLSQDVTDGEYDDHNDGESEDGCSSDVGEELDEEESYMYQTSGSEAVRVMVEECLGLPLVEYRRRGRSVNTSLAYHQETKDDEVEDLYRSLVQAREQWGDDAFEAVSSGAILSTYQRVRVENVCSRLGLKSLGFLWRKASQQRLLDSMIVDGMEAVLVRVAAPPGLQPRRHLNRSIRELQTHFQVLWEKYQFHVCGEGGEYETLVLDSPIFRRRLVLDEIRIVETADDGVGELRVVSCHAEAKEQEVDASLAMRISPAPAATTQVPLKSLAPLSNTPNFTTATNRQTAVRTEAVASVRVRCTDGGLVCMGDVRAQASRGHEPLVSSAVSEVDVAVNEAVEILRTLQLVLHNCGCTPEDVAMVHLYLSEISHFSTINQHYRDFFGVVMPPSRVCVGLDTIGAGRRVQIDCWAMRGSGAALRRLQPSPKPARSVLHVQSLSHWAPVCVGPYSQVNTLVSCCCHFVAGQIGLDPPTMQLRAGWIDQLGQSWTNTASILDALGVALDSVVMGLVYVTKSTCHNLKDDFLEKVQEVCDHSRSTNGGVVVGGVEGGIGSKNSIDEFDGYEDEETRRELASNDHLPNEDVSPVPLLVVVIPYLPVGAEVEVEVVAATMEASTTLPSNRCFMSKRIEIESDTTRYELGVHLHSLGSGSISFGLLTASSDEHVPCAPLCTNVLTRVIRYFSEACASSSVHIPRILHLRLFYDATGPHHDDAGASSADFTSIESSFHEALRSVLGPENQPAVSIVPTKGVGVIPPHRWNLSNRTPLLFAIQATMIDPVRAETDLWIHHKR